MALNPDKYIYISSGDSEMMLSKRQLGSRTRKCEPSILPSGPPASEQGHLLAPAGTYKQQTDGCLGDTAGERFHSTHTFTVNAQKAERTQSTANESAITEQEGPEPGCASGP